MTNLCCSQIAFIFAGDDNIRIIHGALRGTGFDQHKLLKIIQWVKFQAQKRIKTHKSSDD
jgi:uncharacterized protein (UPF0335 family)